jgi:hydroxymethylpyrimidine/phosphomethylpyrimidine kinase
VTAPQILLTIAGFDPSSGAGVTADLAVFAAQGCFGIACVTALTVQSTRGVRSLEPVSAAVVAETLACLEDDLPPVGIKIGMLARAQNVVATAEYLERLRGMGRRPVVVLDPVLQSSSGGELLDAAGLDVLRERLLGLADWVTPNAAELGVLTGLAVNSRETAVEAARLLGERYPGLGVVATGGHLEPPDDLVLEAAGAVVWLPGQRIDSRATHGTGCAFSSALLAGLVQGLPGVEAARAAKEFVAEAIRRAPGLGSGAGPMGLLWPLRR